jgi:hypothetical protein
MEMTMAAAVTVSVAGGSYAALNPDKITADARAVADKATCRTVDTAIVGFIAVNEADPTSITQLKPYIDGDISRYRIVGGRAAGPGC